VSTTNQHAATTHRPLLLVDIDGVLNAFDAARLTEDQRRTVVGGYRVVLDRRHPTWFDDETNQALRAGGAALCISESEDLATPLVATAGWGYLRLRRQDYDDAAVTAWAGRIAAQPWDETYVFFKHEDEGKGPQLATSLLASPLLASPLLAVAADETSVS
jgi:uncharacterized protein YecE (DUF72 family)